MTAPCRGNYQLGTVHTPETQCKNLSWSVVTHTFKPNTLEAEVQGQPVLQSEFQDSQSYTEEPLPQDGSKIRHYNYTNKGRDGDQGLHTGVMKTGKLEGWSGTSCGVTVPSPQS
ncbi:mCG145765 [Mus musculus]|jgi:hypothetical protein|nr:mCG145765 [Mus musculus]